MYKPFLFFAFIIIGLTLACSRNPDLPQLLVLKGATIIDCTRNAPIENGILIIEGQKIQSVGKAKEVKIPKGPLEKGKQADILIMNENPLESIKNFINIDQVFIKGELVNRTELEENKLRKN